MIRKAGWLVCIMLFVFCSCSSSKNNYNKRRKMKPCDCPKFVLAQQERHCEGELQKSNNGK
jgi:hypothetical protein